MDAAEQTTTARCRQTDSPRLIHLIRGDLDWIAMKCLDKDRNRRYETATGLAADLKRYLDNEIVEARPPGKFYRFQKMVRRNRLVFGAVGGILAVLLLGTVISIWQAVRATRAEQEQAHLRQEAEMQRQNEKRLRQQAETAEEKREDGGRPKANRSLGFLTEMLQGVHSP